MTDISVIIPCYNAERWVGRAIESVLDQQGLAVEVIVVDDGSTDGSLDVIKSFGDRIRWETGPNRGGCAARNRGTELSFAPFLHFLDADDYLEGDFLASGLRAMRRQNAEIAIGVQVKEHEAQRLIFEPPRRSCILDLINWLWTHELGVQQGKLIFARNLIDRAGLWDPAFTRFQDLEFVMRCISARPRTTTWDEGNAVYSSCVDHQKLSQKYDDRSIDSLVRAVRAAHGYTKSAGIDESTADSLARPVAYWVWREACRRGSLEAARAAERLFRELGGESIPGTLPHRVAVSLLGLRTKERLSLTGHSVMNQIKKEWHH